MTAAQRDGLLLHIDKQVDKINIQLEGNGNKGVFTRLEEIEKWQDGRPKNCPVVEKRKKILAARGLEVAVAVAIFKGLELLIKFLQARGIL